MTSKRWLNIVLWGLGDRLDGTNDYRSDILLLVDALVWIGLLTLLVGLGSGAATFWIAAPLVGQPVYWAGTQVAIGYLMSRSWTKKAFAAQAPKAQPRASGEPVVSEEP